MNIKKYAGIIEPEIYEVYKNIHENPELGRKEIRTSAYIRGILEKYIPSEDILPFAETGFAFSFIYMRQ